MSIIITRRFQQHPRISQFWGKSRRHNILAINTFYFILGAENVTCVIMKYKEKVVCIFNMFNEKFTTQFGFRVNDVTFSKSVEYFYMPKDSSSLAVTRILFGLAMLLDILEERGGAIMLVRWGHPRICHFPLLPFLEGLPMPYIALVYGALWIGALGIMLGYKYRTSATVFAVCYWYLFLIEKSHWNNHSYLFGLVSLLLIGTQANCYWSLDAYFDPNLRSETVPYWNYFVLKYQFFILYFVAGLKKGTAEWLTGYSLPNLSKHWVFLPFRLFLSAEQTDYLIVHWFAFLFDLTIAFWMMWSRTRHVAMVFCAAFHLMNSQLFKIGMFPWVCLATMPLFYPFDWPKTIYKQLTELKKTVVKSYFNLSGEDRYCEKTVEFDALENIDEEEKNEAAKRGELDTSNLLSQESNSEEKETKEIPTQRKVTAGLIIFYMALQGFLPYSHFLTKGYNNWTHGLYGYSWDMMVHTWDVQLVVVKIVDNDRQRQMYVDPLAWTYSDRWMTHGDMILQFARCLERNIKQETGELKNISIYVDVWCSMNGRFQQRMYDPKVDMLKASWSPFENIQWLMPLLSEAETWRHMLDGIRSDVHSWNNFSDVFFAADFPGYDLENYLPPELINVTLTVLQGTVAYEPEVTNISTGQSHIRKPGDVTHVKSGRFHKVINVGSKPAYYMYTFLNKTEAEGTANLNENQDKPQRPLGSFGKTLDNALTFFQLVFSSIYQVFFRMPMSVLIN